MTVPQGYKQTGVGVIPDDWELRTLGDIAHIERGKFTARPRNDPRYFGGNIPFIQTGDVSNSGGYVTTFSQTLNAEGLKVSKLFPRGTLFFTIAANIGDVAFAAFDVACPDSLVAIVPTKSADKVWLAFELTQRKASFESIATQNAQLNINLEKLRPYLLPLPPLPEQRAIAAALSDVDALLDSLDRLIAKKRAIKQATMQQLLTGRTRLPGFSGEWEEKRLGDLAKCVRGVTYSSERDLRVHDKPDTKRLLRSNNVQNSTIIREDLQFVHESRVSTEQELQDSDILICMANGSRDLVGKAGYVRKADEYTYTFGAFMAALRANSLVCSPRFVFYLFQTNQYRNYINVLLAGSSINNLRPSTIEGLEFQFPPLPEQTAIATVLTDMDTELEGLEARRDKTRLIKQGMMQELLTGRIRLV
jgi:type I restriction enzyme S subunit